MNIIFVSFLFVRSNPNFFLIHEVLRLYIFTRKRLQCGLLIIWTTRRQIEYLHVPWNEICFSYSKKIYFRHNIYSYTFIRFMFVSCVFCIITIYRIAYTVNLMYKTHDWDFLRRPLTQNQILLKISKYILIKKQKKFLS